MKNRQHFAATCFKQGWTASVAELINISHDTLVPTNIQHQYIKCAPELRVACLQYILRKEIQCQQSSSTQKADNPISQAAGDSVNVKQAIVFIDQKQVPFAGKIQVAAERVFHQNKENTSPQRQQQTGDSTDDSSDSVTAKVVEVDVEVEDECVALLTEKMNIADRGSVLHRFRNGDLRVLICADVAARGLDVPNTALIVQMSLPPKLESYLHRSGRTGRLNRPGKVITLIDAEEEFVVRRYENQIGVPITERKLKVNKSKK